MILGDSNIKRLLFKLSLPATVGMIVMSLYNVVDAIFIGHGVGTAGIAGVALVFPIQMIVGAIGQMVGIGGASILSRSLGANDFEKANKVLGNVIATVAAFSLTITLLGLLYMDELLIIFGASPTLLPYAKEYLFYILLGFFMHSLAMALNNLARAEGKAKIAMTTMLVSALMNILLDAIFIFGLGMGIRGAAIATLISYIASALFLIIYFLSRKSLLRLRFREIRFDFAIQKEIFAIGISAFVRQTATSLLVIILNNTLGKYGGDLSIAVYGVVMRLTMLIFTPILGISHGLQPIAGYNYGAKNYAKTRESVKLAMIVSTCIATVGTLIVLLFPEKLLSIFTTDEALIREGKSALQYMIIAFPTVGFQVIGTTLFQATGKAVETFVLTLSRQILFLIPLVFILPKFFEITGIWLSFPIADILSAILTLALLLPVRNQYAQQIKLSAEGGDGH
jgi:putative MATE family efflux protein